jgi:hypothetical protein
MWRINRIKTLTHYLNNVALTDIDFPAIDG